ncbi:thioredoxin domain-containing protein 3 homolog isoform X4 [Branchiostoma lanceolatum]|uniref:thioredoxin domain-containing protein 3 homolog isoform X2 n=1 Tax=Branchiostoma lanceolatum TaxID=7740 RepID=UPI0034552BC4
MARKKEIQLQEELKNQEQWDDFLSKKGLGMIDVYQAWAGPCAAVNGMLRRIKNELGDDLLRFASAEADNIEALERYRGRCQPTFLFMAGGELVHVIRGANAPLINKAIPDLLKAEHSVLEDGSERKVITDPIFDQEDKETEAEEEEEEAGEEEAGPQKEVTVAIIKPDAVQAGHVEDIIQRVKDAGFEILAQEERMLTEEEAREFYSHKADEEFFDELVAFMASGPSHVLVLTKGDDTGAEVIDEWRKIIGPFDSTVAKEEAPDSLRAQYGTDKSMNALHGSDSHEMATRELAFFFPNFQIPKAEAKPAEKRLQRTLALIRPDALKEHKDEILAKIQEAGFTVALQKEMQLTKDQAAEFYKEHEGQDYFEQLIESMTCGPLLALGLAREDAVERWRDLLGPKEVPVAKEEAPDSLRAQFAVEDVPVNPLHGSDSLESAEKEVQFFFPMQQTLAVVKPDAQEHKDAIIARIKEAGFNIAFQKETALTEELAQQLYTEHEGKEFYPQLVEHMTSGPSLFMVLSVEDAVEKFRSLMGPTDPEVAKEQSPDSLRAQFASDMLKNALHGSSNPDHAQEKIKAIFGDIEFNMDGTVKGMEPELDMVTEGDKEPAEGEEGEKEGEGEGGEKPAEEEGEKKEEEEAKPEEEGETPAAEKPAAEEQKEETPEGGEEAKAEEGGNEGAQEETSAEQTNDAETKDENEQKEAGENEGSEQAEGNEGEKESPEEEGTAEPAAEPAQEEGGEKEESTEKESEEKPEGGEAEAEAAAPAEVGEGEGEKADEEKPVDDAEQKEGEKAEEKPAEPPAE